MPDDYTLQHLAAWLDRHVPTNQREEVLTGILDLLARDPEWAMSHPWDEVARAAGASWYREPTPPAFYQHTVRC